MSTHHARALGPLVRLDDVHGRVLAVSDTAAYVTIADDRLVVVHATAHGGTPTSVLVDDARPRAWGVQPGDHVRTRLGLVHLGPAVVDARHATRRVPSAATPRRAGAPPPARLAVPDDARARSQAACRALLDALDAADDAGIASAVRALVGTGVGSTPSGDDALVGVLTVLSRSGRRHDARAVGDAVRPLLPRTTPVSAHYLRLAADGHAGEHLTALVDACLHAGAPTPACLAVVLATGATSGADALVGVDVALDRWRDRVEVAA